MTADNHLTEEERQGIADGSLPVAQRDEPQAHLETCDACRSDVTRLTRLMTLVNAAPSRLGTADDLWPEIRSRIEQQKIVAIPPADAPVATPPLTRRWLPAVAASVIFVLIGLFERGTRSDTQGSRASTGTTTLAVALDSTQAYQQEVQTLLNQLELRRAMMRPETVASIDKSLKAIDQAIAELQDALRRDPNNPALRQLLASSYRQKVDLLKRVGNAS